MRFLVLLTLTHSIANSLECHSYLDSPLIPAIIGLNNTCSGEYCYRIEYKIQYEYAEANEQSVLMGCFDYPLATLKLGCRRNYEGMVLCVCNTRLCNAAVSSMVVDLPVIDDCRYQPFSMDGAEDTGETCQSNYCFTYRGAISDDSSATPLQIYTCQDDSLPPLARFDVFVRTNAGTSIPAGICASFQQSEMQIEELCACQYSANCTTPSKYPGKSGLPLDSRTKGIIDCAMPSMFGGMKKCQGHVCFVSRAKFGYENYGCITYDERFMDKKFKLGLQNILQTAYYICDKNMCNANVDPDKIFGNISFPLNAPPISESCNCFAPPDQIVGQPKPTVAPQFSSTTIRLPSSTTVPQINSTTKSQSTSTIATQSSSRPVLQTTSTSLSVLSTKPTQVLLTTPTPVLSTTALQTTTTALLSSNPTTILPSTSSSVISTTSAPVLPTTSTTSSTSTAVLVAIPVACVLFL